MQKSFFMEDTHRKIISIYSVAFSFVWDPNEENGGESLTAKRFFDIVFATVMITLTLPLLALIAVLIKLDSRGPIIYSQVRVGENKRRRYGSHFEGDSNRRKTQGFGRPFNVLKFRSMRTNAEVDGRPVWCQSEDPRITRMGSILRKTHLDELPQLFNILRGEMSLVGPRPERPELMQDLVQKVPGYHKRLLVKPGLTGMAQILHRSDLDLSDVKKKLKYDLLYVKNISLLTDLRIVVGTVPLVFGLSADQNKRYNLNINRTLTQVVKSVTMLAIFFTDWMNSR